MIREGIEWWHLDKEEGAEVSHLDIWILRQESVPGVVKEEWGSQLVERVNRVGIVGNEHRGHGMPHQMEPCRSL